MAEQQQTSSPTLVLKLGGCGFLGSTIDGEPLSVWKSRFQKLVRRADPHLRYVVERMVAAIAHHARDRPTAQTPDKVHEARTKVFHNVNNRIYVSCVEEGALLMLHSADRTQLVDRLCQISTYTPDTLDVTTYGEIATILQRCAPHLCRPISWVNALCRLCMDPQKKEWPLLATPEFENVGPKLEALRARAHAPHIADFTKARLDALFKQTLKRTMPPDIQRLYRLCQDQKVGEINRKRMVKTLLLLLARYPQVFGKERLVDEFPENIAALPSRQEEVAMGIWDKHVSVPHGEDRSLESFARHGAETPHLREATWRRTLRFHGQSFTLRELALVYLMEKIMTDKHTLSLVPQRGAKRKAPLALQHTEAAMEEESVDIAECVYLGYEVQLRTPKPLRAVALWRGTEEEVRARVGEVAGSTLTWRVDLQIPMGPGFALHMHYADGTTTVSRAFAIAPALSFKTLAFPLNEAGVARIPALAPWLRLGKGARRVFVKLLVPSTAREQALHRIVHDAFQDLHPLARVRIPQIHALVNLDAATYQTLLPRLKEWLLPEAHKYSTVVARRLEPDKFVEGPCFLVQEWVNMVRLKHMAAEQFEQKDFQHAWLALLLQNYLMPITDFNSSNTGWSERCIYRFDLTLAPDFDEAHARRRARGVATAQRLSANLLKAATEALPEFDVARLVQTVLTALSPQDQDTPSTAQVRAEILEFANNTDLAATPTRARVEDLLRRAASFPSVSSSS